VRRILQYRGPRTNTVYLVRRIATTGGALGCSRVRWTARLSGNLDIFRLTTRGFERSRRRGSGSPRISSTARARASVMASGGKEP